MLMQQQLLLQQQHSIARRARVTPLRPYARKN